MVLQQQIITSYKITLNVERGRQTESRRNCQVRLSPHTLYVQLQFSAYLQTQKMYPASLAKA